MAKASSKGKRVPSSVGRAKAAALSSQSSWKRLHDPLPPTKGKRLPAFALGNGATGREKYIRPQPLWPARKGYTVESLPEVKRFSVWLDRRHAIICDSSIPLDQHCRVLWIEDGNARDVGTVMMEQPDQADEVKIRIADDGGCPPYLRVPRSHLVRIIGCYEAHHENGMLPQGNELRHVTGIARSMVYGDGTPIAFHSVLLPR